MSCFHPTVTNAGLNTADFVYEENGKTVVEDVKGVRTRDYILKRKLFKYNYPDIQFREVD